MVLFFSKHEFDSFFLIQKVNLNFSCKIKRAIWILKYKNSKTTARCDTLLIIRKAATPFTHCQLQMSMKCQQSKQINKFNHKNITFDPFECGEHFVEMDYIPCHAIASGVFGTAASVFGKFISHTDQLTEKSTSDSNDEVNISIECGHFGRWLFGLTQMYSIQELMLRWSLKVVCIALMVICNVFVWTFFVKALHQRGGSIIATVTSTATNYCGSVCLIKSHFECIKRYY